MKKICIVQALALFAIIGQLVRANPPELPQAKLILDLDADRGVSTEDGRVVSWSNQVDFVAREFRATRPAGRPALRKNVAGLGGRGSVEFHHQELQNFDEDAFDGLITGGGYTWIAVMCATRQHPQLQDVNCFFGNLKNGGMYEGIWGNLNDDNSVWIGSRNGVTFGRWNSDNPKVVGPKLDENRYFIVAGRMGAGTNTVLVELFVNDAKPVASLPFPVNPKANSSKMAVGQERDATNHPGKEAFDGEIARLLIWERPLTDAEIADTFGALKKYFGL